MGAGSTSNSLTIITRQSSGDNMRNSPVLILFLLLSLPSQGLPQSIAEPFKVGTFEINGSPTVAIVLRDSLIVELDAAKSPVGAAAFKIYLTGVPVDPLLAGSVFEIDSKDSAVAFALLASPDDRCGNQFG